MQKLVLCSVMCLLAGPGMLLGQTVSLVTLGATPNPSVYGHPVAITATLTGGATGKVTFFDGTAVIGTSTISGTNAVWTTSLLGTGLHSLTAIYQGDSGHFQSVSPAISQTVNSVAATGFVVSNIGITPSGSGIPGVVSGDFNGDGKTDVALLAGSFNSVVEVLPGNGDGTFGTPINSSTTLNGTDFRLSIESSTPLVTGDFNGDGKADVAFGVDVQGGEDAWVMIGNGDGTFQSPTMFLLTNTMFQRSAMLVVGDFNGDGKPDIFDSPYMLLGNGDGTFQPAMTLANATTTNVIATGDFNGDGVTDIAYESSTAGKLTVQLGTGSGTFQNPVSYTIGGNIVSAIATGDFDGDGKTDLGVINSVSGPARIDILPGKGDGTFKTPITSAAGQSGISSGPEQAVIAADVNGDGKLDLGAVSLNGFNLLLGNGDGSFQPNINYTGNNNAAPSNMFDAITAGDFNGDGRVDILSSQLYTGAITGYPVLSPAITDPGTFRQGMSGTYTVTVTNTASAATLPAPQVTVSVTLPAGLTATALSGGSNWGCNLSSLTCSTQGGAVLAAGESDVFTLAVNIASNASTPQMTAVSVVGGGAASTTATDSTTILPVNILQITKTHTGNFTQSQNGVYAVTVSNSATGPGSTSGGVTVTDTVPTGMSLITMSGSGWSCPPGNTCTRNDVLPVGASYPSIMVTVSVAVNAASSLTNQASVSGGGSLTATASDPTTILRGQGISFTPVSNVPVGTAPFTITAQASSGLPVSLVSNTPAVCTLSGTTVTIVMAGGCSITGTQAGNGVYGPAVPAVLNFTVLFGDVSSTDSDYAAINAMAQLGITAGCGNNDFCPSLNVSRDEMAIFVVRAIYGNDNFTYTATPYFTDVTPSTFGFKWIQKLKDLGITNGCTATTYCPTDVVARDQMAVFIERARLGVSIAGPSPTFTYPTTPYFSDVTASEFAFPWIQRMKLDGITSGCTATTYCPTDAVTRGAMAIFIMRGAFNQFLPAGTPVISSISPSTLAVGTSGTYTITGVNTNFAQGTTTLSPIPGVTLGTITVNNSTSMTVQLTASSSATAQPYSVLAITGSEQAVLPNGLVLQ